MQLKHVKTILCITLIVLAGCANTNREPDERVQNYRYSTIDDELWVIDSDGESYLVPVEGQNFYPLASPNSDWLAVEVQLFSNLRTLKIYRKVVNEYVETDHPAATYLWQRAAQENGVDPDNVTYPGIRILRWLNEDRIEVEMSGRDSNGEAFSLTFQFDVSELQK